MCIRVYSTRCTSVRAKDSYSLAPTAKWGLPFILEWSELYEQRPELYEPLIGGWLQETSGRPVKFRVVRLAKLRLTAATALQYPTPITEILASYCSNEHGCIYYWNK